MTEETQSTFTLREKLVTIPLAVYPIAVVVMMVGNLTGDYQGYYAQTAVALQLQQVLVVLMIISPFIWIWGVDDPDERLDDVRDSE